RTPPNFAQFTAPPGRSLTPRGQRPESEQREPPGRCTAKCVGEGPNGASPELGRQVRVVESRGMYL
ncbi:MAG: hypothetical protein ACE5JU_07660, partial [Candidatus Binatia bacterium]